MTEENQEYFKFVIRLLKLIGDNDCTGELIFRSNDVGTVDFSMMCNDVFWWGCSDAEDVTPDNIDILEKSFADVSAVVGDRWAYEGVELFCCRSREMRPQGVCYPKEEALWPLFDACGPEREVGFGNPHPHPSQKKQEGG